MDLIGYAFPAVHVHGKHSPDSWSRMRPSSYWDDHVAVEKRSPMCTTRIVTNIELTLRRTCCFVKQISLTLLSIYSVLKVNPFPRISWSPNQQYTMLNRLSLSIFPLDTLLLLLQKKCLPPAGKLPSRSTFNKVSWDYLTEVDSSTDFAGNTLAAC